MAGLAVPSIAAAQLAGAGTGSIVGVVRDATGNLVADAAITLAGRSIMQPRATTSREDGEYRFALLPPGDYELTVTSRGFERHTVTTQVGLGATQTIDVTLTVARQLDAVVVRGALDRFSAAVSQRFDARLLDSLPGSRNMGGLLQLTHAFSASVVEVGGGLSLLSGAYGAYGRSNSPRHTIEGIVVTGLFGSGFTPDYGALEEASVLTGAHGAEWSSSGIHTDFVTKSGANQYRGSLYGAAEPRQWQSSNIEADQIAKSAGRLSVRDNQVWRYSDANADIGGFLRKDRLWWYTSFRRQEAAARLVTFDVVPHVTRLTNYSGKATARLFPGQTLVFYGQLGLNHQPYRLDPWGGGNLSAATAINETIDSTIDQRNAAWLWKAEWNAVVGDSMVFEVRAGQFATEQDWSPRSSEARVEDIETLVVSGGNRDFAFSGRRNQVSGTASYFTHHRTGRHYLRFGGEGLRFLVRETWFSGFPGNVVHVLRSGRPSSVFLFDTPSLSEAGVWSWSGYASDAWQPSNRLTITAGLRLDFQRLFLPAQAHPAGSPKAKQFAAVPNLIDWSVVSPRFAAVYDVEGNGRTLAKLNYGRYPGAANAGTAFNSNPNSAPWWREYPWTDLNHNLKFETGEEGELRRSRGGADSRPPIESLDPGLRLPVVDEAGAWIERALPGGITLRTGGVWRFEQSPFARQNLRQPYDRFTVPVEILDRGPDGLAGTPDDGVALTAYDLQPDLIGQQPEHQVRNVPGATSQYVTWEIAATRQARGRWSFGAGFAHTWHGDHAAGYAGQSVRSNAYPVTPNDLINTGNGGRHEFTTWTAKAYGTVEGPWQLRVTPVLRHQSGQPFGRTQTSDPGQLRYGTVTMLMEPVGTRRMDHITLLDVRVDKAVQVRAGRVRLFLDVFNLLNTNPEQNVIWASGESFLRPLSIVPPRIARVGFTFDW